MAPGEGVSIAGPSRARGAWANEEGILGKKHAGGE